MGSVFETLCLALLIFLVAAPVLYGLHLYLLVYLAHRRRAGIRDLQQQAIARFSQNRADEAWPKVTTQLPIFNELAVATRVIEAAARMDYPIGRHEIQVLDDSTDATREIVDAAVARFAARGVPIQVIRRGNREHYKAGALAHGLQSAQGEFVAIFDADFVPDRKFLRRLIPLIAADAGLCAVQGRWGHLNGDESWITQGLALGLDMHFSIEQPARSWNGLLLNFNGTAGIWRRTAIDDARVGGWSGDTITEDLDLSYRAQLAGWRIAYCMDEIAPAELPADVAALKAQQRRWATGSIQTARKILPRVWRSDLNLGQKLEASFHLAQYAIAILMLLVALFGRLLPLGISSQSWPVWLGSASLLFLAASLAPTVAYIYGRYVLGGGIVGPLTILKLMLLGLGLSVNNGVAALVGLFQRGGEFVRTPKSGSTGESASPRAPAGALPAPPNYYAVLRGRLWMIELALGGFCFFQWLYFLEVDGWIGGSYLLLYGVGLTLIGWGSRTRTAPPVAPQPLEARPAAAQPVAGMAA